MGGGELFASLLAGGVVDEIGLNLHPVLLGEGARLFPPGTGRPSLTLLESRTLAKGCVWLSYKPAA